MYAIENGFEFIDITNMKIIGDLDGDREITPSDALFILQMSVGLIQITDELKEIGDINKDGEVTPDDALKILQYSVGLLESL